LERIDGHAQRVAPRRQTRDVEVLAAERGGVDVEAAGADALVRAGVHGVRAIDAVAEAEALLVPDDERLPALVEEVVAGVVVVVRVVVARCRAADELRVGTDFQGMLVTGTRTARTAEHEVGGPAVA
jgi:hypothetical protein